MGELRTRPAPSSLGLGGGVLRARLRSGDRGRRGPRPHGLHARAQGLWGPYRCGETSPHTRSVLASSWARSPRSPPGWACLPRQHTEGDHSCAPRDRRDGRLWPGAGEQSPGWGPYGDGRDPVRWRYRGERCGWGAQPRDEAGGQPSPHGTNRHGDGRTTAGPTAGRGTWRARRSTGR